MLATLVIGLREGLEAALIVGIIAAFLKRNGKPLRAMWIGVTVAILLSIAVGVTLEAVSAALPQAQQEALETVIGAVAVFFVTSMIVWMSKHARNMKRELEASAGEAIGEGSAWALAGMAFLAVLKEGFETSVFLLATFQSSTSVLAAVAGAVIGIVVAAAIGYGIYRGGVKLNLGRFFKITGVFLIFVAAGLVLSALRTAHEAGWITIGQQSTVDISWLAPNGSIQAALITGVLGIPAQPALIEVLGWFLYLIPVLAYTLWPQRLKPAANRVPRVQFAFAGGLAIVAIVLALAVPTGAAAKVPVGADLQKTAAAPYGSITIQVIPKQASLQVSGRAAINEMVIFKNKRQEQHDGVAATKWSLTRAAARVNDSGSGFGASNSLTLDQVIELNGGRLPVGLDTSLNPGPFKAVWKETARQTIWIVNNGLLDATSSSTTTVTLSGGGLNGVRTISAPADPQTNWIVSPAYVEKTTTAILNADSAARELLLWKLWLPLALVVAAVVLTLAGLRNRRRLIRAAQAEKTPETPLTPKEPSYARN